MKLTPQQHQIVASALLRYGQAEQVLGAAGDRVNELCTALAGDGYVVKPTETGSFELLTAAEHAAAQPTPPAKPRGRRRKAGK